MRNLVASEGLEAHIDIDSAGTAAYHTGELPDKRSREAARRRGIRLESRARQFQAEDFIAFDYVLAMDRENFENLEALRDPEAGGAELALLRSFDALAPSGAEVPDPYYGGERGFDDVLDLCAAACRGLLEHLRRQAELG